MFVVFYGFNNFPCFGWEKSSQKRFNTTVIRLAIQGVLLLDRQTLRGDSRHEDKYYIGNQGA